MGDFDRLDWCNRPACIVFDGNAAANTSVSAARRALAHDLIGRGARVRLVDLPIEPGVNGPDDFIGRHGDQAFFDVVDAAPEPGVSPQDFYAYMPQHAYIFTPTREIWPAARVNARLGQIPLLDADGAPVIDDRGKVKTIAASAWLDCHHRTCDGTSPLVWAILSAWPSPMTLAPTSPCETAAVFLQRCVAAADVDQSGAAPAPLLKERRFPAKPYIQSRQS